MNIKKIMLVLIASLYTTTYSKAPFGLFLPYDINIMQRKPSHKSRQLVVLTENSYKVRGFATDEKEEETEIVNPLQIYEKHQNFIAMYQSVQPNTGSATSSEVLQILDSIAGGPGGGVRFSNKVSLTPTAKFSIGQCSLGFIQGLGKGFYISAYLPVYYAKMTNLSFKFDTSTVLFSDFALQDKITKAFTQDAKQLFGLDICNWKQHHTGDLTLLAEWQRTFAQQRQTLKSVETNLRVGLSLPTGKAAATNLIMPISFGNEGSWAIPFGGGLSINIAHLLEFGFAAQMEYIFSNEQDRRIKTFNTQSSLLYPSITKTHKEFAIIQNLSLHATLYSRCNRFSLKNIYTYYRKPADIVIPLSPSYNFNVANSAAELDETTLHQYCLCARYHPLSTDFKRAFPQFTAFYKHSFNGMRIAGASTYGFEVSLIF